MDEKGKTPLPRKIRQAERRTRTDLMLGKELGGTGGVPKSSPRQSMNLDKKKDVPLSYATCLLCRIGGIAKNVKGELRKGFFIFLFVS